MGASRSKCQICSKLGAQGIRCHKNHFYCTACITSYVEKTCESTPTISEQGLVIRCPVFNCTSKPWNYKELREILKGPSLEKYLETVVKLSASAKSSRSMLKFRKTVLGNKINQAMQITCPNCNTLYDRLPSGNCAVRCFHCQNHFCWLCFKSCFNMKSCQSHVIACPSNKFKTLNPPFHAISIAHKQHKIKLLQDLVRSVRLDFVHNNITGDSLSSTCITCLSTSSSGDNNEAATIAADELIDSVLIEKAALLKENGIEYQDIYI